MNSCVCLFPFWLWGWGLFVLTPDPYIDDYYFLIAKYFEGVGDRSSYCNIFSYSRGAEDGCENKIFFFCHTCQITVKT